MSKRRYPADLFWFGYISNVVFHYFWLFWPSIILMLIGIFVKPCMYAALALLVIDLIVSFIDQMLIRRAFLQDSDNPDFRDFQDALSKDGDWRENIHEIIESKIQKFEEDDKNDSDDEKKGE